MYACNNNQSNINNEEAEELVVDIEYYDSLSNAHKDFKIKIETEGKLLPVNNTENFRIYQSVSSESLSKDTLLITKDGSWLAYPDSTKTIDARHWYQYAIAFKDIDTNNISSSVVDDVLWINIPSIDTLGAIWGKFDTKLNRWHWRVPSNEVRLGYLVSIDKISKNYKSYMMYEPRKGSSIDYAASTMDSVHVSRLYSDIRSMIIDYAEK